MTSLLPSHIAPHGILRVAINLGNPVLAGLDAAGEPSGISADLSRKLAAQLEEELAQTRLQLVALQAERDSDDAILQNRRPQERLGLGAGQRSKGGEDRDSGRTIPLRRTNENRPANVWSASSETEERNSWHM